MTEKSRDAVLLDRLHAIRIAAQHAADMPNMDHVSALRSALAEFRQADEGTRPRTAPPAVRTLRNWRV